jgi:hypothetical protein
MGHAQLKQMADRMIYWSYVHLMVSFFSLIILSCWGLGLSPFTIAGNLIFSPVLYVFLLLATALFFSELLGIPNMALISCIELLNKLWIGCMQLAQPYFCNMLFAKPPLWQLGIMVTAALAILVTHTGAHKKLCFLALLILYSFYYGFPKPAQDRIITIPCNQGEVTVIQHAQTLWLIDPGHIGRTSGAQAFIEHCLLPTIAREFGTNHIDYLILLQPTGFLFKALASCLQRMQITHLYIPYWQGEQPGLKYAYMTLKKVADQQQIPIKRSVKGSLVCTSSATGSLRINQEPQPYKKGTLTVGNLWVSGKVDNNDITIYSAEYTNQIKKNSKNQSECTV